MFEKLLRRLPQPRSLKWQFMFALLAPTLLIVAGGITAVYDLHLSSETTRQLSGDRLERLQQARDLVECALLIERESDRMLIADSLDSMQAGYLEILNKLDLLDSLVLGLGRASNNFSALDLNRAGQLYRNTVHIAAQLRKNLLDGKFAPPESARQQETLAHLHGELHHQAVSLVDSAHDLSAGFTLDYQEMIRQLTAKSVRDQEWVTVLLAGSILLAWLVSRYFLGRHVVGRLQQVSNYMRLGETDAGSTEVPVHGDDEIGDMARAVEQFLEDRRLLVQTQSDLRQKEEMLRAIIDAAPVAIIGLDLDGNVHSVWNQAAERMLGWSAGEVMGRPLPTVPKDKVKEARRFGEQIQNGLTLEGIEVRRRKRDGTPIDYSIYASPLHDAEGRITGGIAVFLDITERKRTEHALKLTQFSVDRTVDAVYWTNPDAHFIYVNDSACRALGYSRPEFLAMSVPDVHPELTMDIWRSHWEELREKKSLVFEASHRRKDGSTFPVEIAANYVQFEDKEYNCGFARDITERKQAREVLRFEREQLLSIFDSIDQNVYVTDPQTYEILYANQAVKKAFQKDLTGGICYRDFQGFDTPCSFCTNKIILEQKPAPYRWEYYNSSIDRYFDITDCIITWPDGRDVRLEIAFDITKRKLLEHQLQHRNEDLERSNAELDDFAYIVSHDLKEPLRSIHSFSSFVLNDYRERLDDEGQSFLDIVMKSAERMAALLDDLLIYSRVGRAELAKMPTDLSRVVAGVLEDMRTLLAEQNAHVTVAGDLPVIVCDHVRIGEVFRNLIQNAVKYNDSEEKRIEVGRLPMEVSEQAPPVFFVRDNGIGIREKHVDNVFKIFKRLHGRDQYGGGTGSGLTIVRKIVERHGGRVWVESVFGGGSTFYFTLGPGHERGEADEG